MRLCNIKLSGFKSFVDHTNLIVPGNLVGIVGPNGCGKSNIIDAVTWVMGESSAKHLRGDALTDVIFSGSSARQPVGQASVELVFDNTEKKLGGQYASYNEISIKRQINRDGVSTYYLNGARCRRRDITAIFLGTGLGPRSYAIIEQGMISRLIEAKPEELRVYIEEAAGISKYRERRRETENRIKHTKENIDRLNDIREELEKQLNHLQRQAKAAERYKTFKQEERQLSAELLALNWRDLDQEMVSLKDHAGKRENEVEAAVARVRQIEADVEKQREALSEANQAFNERQSEYYRIGSDIAQYEQQLQHTREKISSIESELEKTLQSQAETQTQHSQDKSEYEHLLKELQSLEPQLNGSRDESNKAYEILNQAEEAMQLWQSEWEVFNDSFAEFSRQEQADKSRYEHLQTGLDEIKEKRHQLQSELDKYEQSDLVSKIQQLNNELAGFEAEQQKYSQSRDGGQQAVKQQRETVRELALKLDSARHQCQTLKGKLSSLETLQQSIAEDNSDLSDWLKQNQLDQFQRLSQLIKIDKNWSHALETVLSSRLNHICVDNFDDYLAKLETAPGKFGLIRTNNDAVAANKKDWPRLLDYVTTDIKLPFILNTVYAADNLETALQMLTQLPAGHSIVTQQGAWLGADWVIVNHSEDAVDTILTREQDIESTRQLLIKAEEQMVIIEAELKQAESDLEKAEHEQHENQSALTAQQQKIADLREVLAATQTES